MLLDLPRDFAEVRGDLVRRTGAIVMPKAQTPQEARATATAKELLAATSAGKPVPEEVVTMSTRDFAAVCTAMDDIAHENATRRMMHLPLAALGMD